jgi:hypothetical protein
MVLAASHRGTCLGQDEEYAIDASLFALEKCMILLFSSV